MRQALALRAPGAYASCARRLRLAKTRIRLGRLAIRVALLRIRFVRIRVRLAVAFLSTRTVPSHVSRSTVILRI